MQRQRGELVPIAEALADLPGPVKAIREASPQRNVSRMKSLVLRFTTDDFDNPVHDIVVVGSPLEKGMPRDGVLYSENLKIAERWHARTVAMMKAADPG